MTLPPLPIIDGHLFIDNSFIECLNNCPRNLQYKYLNRRIAADAQEALNFGGAIHEALAHRYRTSADYIQKPDEDHQIKLLEDWFEAKPNPVESHRNLNLASMLIQGYNQKYIGEEFRMADWDGRPAVELPFTTELYFSVKHNIQIMYCGKVDLVVFCDGQFFIVDHKTTSIMGDGFFKFHSVSPQFFGYVFGMEQTMRTRFAGFYINALRVPRPTKKDGLVVKPDDFQRLKVYIHDGQVTEWRQNIIVLIEEFLDQHAKGYLPQKKSWCVHKYGFCEYFDVCALPAENREMILSSGQYVDNEWSPLNNFHSTIKASQPI